MYVCYIHVMYVCTFCKYNVQCTRVQVRIIEPSEIQLRIIEPSEIQLRIIEPSEIQLRTTNKFVYYQYCVGFHGLIGSQQ